MRVVRADGEFVVSPADRAGTVRVIADGLERQFGQALLDLGALDLQDRTFGPGPLAGVFARERAQFGELERGEVDLELGDLALEVLVVDQRLAVVADSAVAIVFKRSTLRFERATPAMPARSCASRNFAQVQPLFSS